MIRDHSALVTIQGYTSVVEGFFRMLQIVV